LFQADRVKDVKRLILTGGMGALSTPDGGFLWQKFPANDAAKKVSEIHIANWKMLQTLKRVEWIFA